MNTIKKNIESAKLLQAATKNGRNKEAKRKIEVCDNCLCASCWHGEFMCDDSRSAGTTLKTVAELSKLGLENKEHYSREKFLMVYGSAAPHGYEI